MSLLLRRRIFEIFLLVVGAITGNSHKFGVVLNSNALEACLLKFTLHAGALGVRSARHIRRAYLSSLLFSILLLDLHFGRVLVLLLVVVTTCISLNHSSGRCQF